MADEKSKFLELTSKPYADQAKWFLNGFWEEGIEKDAETIWKCATKCIELDSRKKEGNELDEFNAHKFLESLGETLTVLQLREKLRKIDLDCNGKMALLEYLAFRFSKGVKEIINSKQGDNTKEVDEATEKLKAVQDAYQDVQTQLDEQTIALSESKAAEKQAQHDLEQQKASEQAAKKALESSKKAREQANNALNDQRAAEETVRKAESDLKAAVDDLNSQETTYKNTLNTLDTKSKDMSASQVTRSKAAAELAQMKQEDPLPLRKAKITQEAALRKVEKERKAAEVATAASENKANAAHAAEMESEKKASESESATASAEESAKEAESKSQALEEQKKRVEEAYQEAEARLKEALDFLEEAKKKGGVAHGSIWWLERELKEAQRYLPKKETSLNNFDQKMIKK